MNHKSRFMPIMRTLNSLQLWAICVVSNGRVINFTFESVKIPQIISLRRLINFTHPEIVSPWISSHFCNYFLIFFLIICWNFFLTILFPHFYVIFSLICSYFWLFLIHTTLLSSIMIILVIIFLQWDTFSLNFM